MNIKSLTLKAFGPFSGQVLDFSCGIPGLHIVYGANEAGKSSAMRALQALLFGFPLRTSDNFLHQNSQLLVGGCLQGSDGKELTFFRRKRNVKDLLDCNDNPVDPSLLRPFLHGVEKNLFTALYGIDHETLVAGGQGILDQQGEVGKSLFAAGAGLASLKPLMDELEAEGDSLFRPQGSSKAINEALAHHKELQTQFKQAILSGRQWEEQEKAVGKALRKKEELQSSKQKLETEKRRLERLMQALPDLWERKNLQGQLEGLTGVRLFPPEFSDRRIILEQKEREARLHYDQLEARRHVLREKMKGLSVNRALLDEAEAIEELHQRLGEYLKAGSDRPLRDGQRIASRSEAAKLLRQIKPELSLDEVESLRPGLLKRRSVHELASRYAALLQAGRGARSQVEDAERALEKAGSDLQALLPVRDTGMLFSLLSAAERAGDVDREIESIGQDRQRAESECTAMLNRLGLWSGTLELAGHLALPLPETVNRFDEEFRLLTDKKRRFEKEKADLEKERKEVAEQLQQLESGAHVPVEEELTKNRRVRDQGWMLLRRQWILGENIGDESHSYNPSLPLHEAYERMVSVSDQIADRLYREADRVQLYSSLKSRLETIEKRIRDAGESEVLAVAAFNELSHRWNEQWAPFAFTPLSPPEMRAWLGAFESLRLQVRELEKHVRDESIKAARRQELKKGLLVSIEAFGKVGEFPGEELTGIVLHGRKLLNSLEAVQKQRELTESKIRDLKRTLDNARDTLTKAEREVGEWRREWHDAVTPLGLNSRTLPAEAIDFIDTLQGCFEKLKDADEFRKRIEGIERDTRCFERDVAALVEKIAPDLSASDARSAVHELKGRLGRASQERAVFLGDSEELGILENALLIRDKELQSCREEMASMRQLACCDTREELIEAEERSNHFKKLTNDILEVDRRLSRIAEGTALADLEVQAESVNPDELPGQIERLNNDIKVVLDPEIQEWSECIGREKNELKRMDGSEKAADLAEAIQCCLTKIRRLTGRYIRVKVAAKILRDETERYRTENQDPVLKIAGRYFFELTMGAFTGLRSDVDDHGQLVLEAVRSNGNCLQVEAMSSGTRDQLYLALRLATLEWRIETSEPMPFIVDDILINFDDQRSRATIRALSGLAEKTQVILFTHHQKIVETAKELQNDGKVFIHQLGAGTGEVN
ncbi:MAG: AAA family ATPase [Chlorobiaceae bacterium]